MSTEVRTEMTKEEEAFASAPPAFIQPMAQQAPAPMYTAVVYPQVIEQADHAGVTCWYVCGILSTIFCCLPCGIIGLVHAMISKHEGERGNLPAHRRRLYQAKCWTSWAIALGVCFLIILIIGAVVRTVYADYWYGYPEDYDIGVDYATAWPTAEETESHWVL